MNPELLAYIRQHRATYTREALRQRLLDAGYPADEIEAAWAAVDADDQPPTPPARTAAMGAAPAGADVADPPRARTSPAFWLTLFGYIGGLYIIVALVAGIASSVEDDGWIASLTFFVLWLAGLVGGLVMMGRNRPVGLGLVVGFAAAVGLPFLLGFILLVIILGICLVGGTAPF